MSLAYCVHATGETPARPHRVEADGVLDAALLSSAQAVEHYEITRYGTLIALARRLGRSDIASVLAETLEEEKSTDAKLTGLAESEVNRRAAA